jgi:hypothetical protein
MYQNKQKKSNDNKKKKPNAQNGRMAFMKKTGRSKKG